MDSQEEDSCEGLEIDTSSGSDGDEEVDEEEEEPIPVKPKKKARSVLTGRGVTLAMLLNDNIVKPGEKCLSIDYLGQKFQADLLSDGKIRWVEANKLFNSPSAWAIYCKKLVNPSKKSGCGWASVKYNGKKLDQYKSVWFKRKRPQYGQTTSTPANPVSSTPTIKSPTASSTPKADTPVTVPKSHGKPGRPRLIKSPPVEGRKSLISSGTKQSQPVTFKSPILYGQASTGHKSPILSGTMLQSKEKGDAKQDLHMKIRAKMKVREAEKAMSKSTSSGSPTQRNELEQQESRVSNLCKSPTFPGQIPSLSPPPMGKRKQFRSRVSLKHSTLSPESDPLSLVECMSFTSLGKIQPFSVSISTNTLLLMDFHSHLTSSEIVGYLGGKWDQNTHHVKIVQAFPCKIRFGDKENAGKVESQIREHMDSLGLHAVGWYHSHPADQPDPSIQDINNQLSFQQSIHQSNPEAKQPLVGFILSPYDLYHPTKETTIRAFWVQQPQDQNLGIPMLINFTIQQDQFLSQDLLNEMRWLGSCYKGCPDSIEFTDFWHNDISYIDKVKESLTKKFPTDQMDGHFANFIHTLLT